MRLDKFLNATNITKCRSVAQDMIGAGVVLVNGMSAKSSKEVKVGDCITINFLEGAKNYSILQIPSVKNVKKSDNHLYWQEK